MKVGNRKTIVTLILTVVWVRSCYGHGSHNSDAQYCEQDDQDCDRGRPSPEWLHLAIVACGDRLDEPLTSLKSAVMFGSKPIHIHVWADAHLQAGFEKTLSSWVSVVKWRLYTYSIHDIEFPLGNANTWRHLFKTCACQRLFIPNLLTDVDSILYVDTDTLFLASPDKVWNEFKKFNKVQLAALAPEGEDAVNNWYTRHARHPYVPPTGVNSGVMLMNLTRMRTLDWGSRMWPIYNQYRTNLTWGDQDVLNVFFHDNPKYLYMYDCSWNYRPDHCMYHSNCKHAEHFGVRVLHGSRGYFHKDKQKLFRDIYKVFKTYEMGDNVRERLLTPLKMAIDKSEDVSPCKQAVAHVFLTHIQQYVHHNHDAPYLT